MTPAERAAAILGFGMGGFLDFIVLHLVLQWHHMISNRLPPVSLEALQRNIFWDGIGQVVMWAIVAGGIWALLGAARGTRPIPSTLRFAGLFLVGWGAFNLLDGIVNHHLLRLHNVREDVADPLAWNLGFMVVAGVLLPLLGLWLARLGNRTPQADRSPETL
jgi:uncharacterized membrane protein